MLLHYHPGLCDSKVDLHRLVYNITAAQVGRLSFSCSNGRGSLSQLLVHTQATPACQAWISSRGKLHLLLGHVIASAVDDGSGGLLGMQQLQK